MLAADRLDCMYLLTIPLLNMYRIPQHLEHPTVPPPKSPLIFYRLTGLTGGMIVLCNSSICICTRTTYHARTTYHVPCRTSQPISAPGLIPVSSM